MNTIPSDVEVVILGSAQDGGVPHAGCICPRCRVARDDYRQRRLPASIGLTAGDDWLIVDPTSAFEEQLHMMWSRLPASARHEGERYQPPGTIIVTHAHTGHYAGLWQLDRSVLAARGTRVLSPPATAAFLAANEPWAAMSGEGFIEIVPVDWGEAFAFAGGVSIELVEVPHRSEWPTDTAALLIRGPHAELLYLPDIDFWDQWDRDIVEVVRSVDIAVLDGTFWEQPTSADVPHPPVVETMGRLAGLTDSTRIVFTHLNHTNPAIDDQSSEAAEASRRGFEIAREGLAFRL